MKQTNWIPIVLLYFIGTFSFAGPPAVNLTLPKPEARKQMVLKLKTEIDRIDGEGLTPRANRPESWDETVSRLVNEAYLAENLNDLGRVFKRLDATYPNLHAKIYLAPGLDEKKDSGSVVLPFKFFPQAIENSQPVTSYKIKTDKSGEELKTGDELISINSVPIEQWSKENFIFCKFPLREQCEVEFYDNFRNELLGWSRHQPLTLEVKRFGQILHVVTKPEIKKSQEDDEGSSLPCGVKKDRYKGFEVTYEGQNLCAFESKKYPGTVALRIKSFRYDDMPFAVLDGEVQIFWNNYWSKKAAHVKKVIIDVIDNWGGQSPVPYYALLYSKPYQEQYVQFKKISEFEKPEILESLFWGDKGKEIWFGNIKKDGMFSNLKFGEFLPPIPQFCSSSKKDCREGFFQPRKNGFNGQIRVLKDHWCISSCVGFVSNIKDLFQDRVKTFGFPDSGDSAYSRLSVLVSPKGNSAEAKVAAMKKAKNPDQPEDWVRQVVSVTRSTDKDGNILSGKPQKIDDWIPRKWDQGYDDWVALTFQKALIK